MRKEIRMAGVGGQGVITMGVIFGRAAAIYDGKEAILTEAYGAEKTGGFTIADLIISDSKITYPKVDNPEILVVMSNDAWERDRPFLVEGGLTLYEQDLVSVAKPDATTFPVPAIKIADELGRRVVANVVMMGVLREVTDLVPRDALEKALLSRVPKGTEELNKTALHRGFEYGEKVAGGNK